MYCCWHGFFRTNIIDEPAGDKPDEAQKDCLEGDDVLSRVCYPDAAVSVVVVEHLAEEPDGAADSNEKAEDCWDVCSDARAFWRLIVWLGVAGVVHGCEWRLVSPM